MTRPSHTDYRTIVACGPRDASEANRGYIHTVLAGYRDPDGAYQAVITGGSRGADAIIHEEAVKLGFATTVAPADWKLHGRRAGPIRNRKMLDFEPDLVLAFWDGKSRGTKDTMDEAKRRGIPVVDAGLVA